MCESSTKESHKVIYFHLPITHLFLIITHTIATVITAGTAAVVLPPQLPLLLMLCMLLLRHDRRCFYTDIGIISSLITTPANIDTTQKVIVVKHTCH